MIKIPQHLIDQWVCERQCAIEWNTYWCEACGVEATRRLLNSHGKHEGFFCEECAELCRRASLDIAPPLAISGKSQGAQYYRDRHHYANIKKFEEHHEPRVERHIYVDMDRLCFCSYCEETFRRKVKGKTT